jgi:hypothetical protein
MDDFDVSLEINEQKVFLDLLNADRHDSSRTGNPAAEWRLRCKRQYAIDDRLEKLGKLALLSGSSLLVALKGDSVEKLERSSNWRTTLKNSTMFSELHANAQAQIQGTPNYKKLEDALQTFGQMLCLACQNLDEMELVKGFNQFKIQCVNYAVASDYRYDEVVNHIKQLGKLCQAYLLGVKYKVEGNFIPRDADGYLLPFTGQLRFIAQFERIGRRNVPLTMRSAFMLAQIGQTPRSLPYPSKDEVIASVKKSFDIMRTRVRVPPEALAKYRKGLAAVKATVPKPDRQTHVSLLGSGSFERPRSSGGRSAVLVSEARSFCDHVVDDTYEKLVGKMDQFSTVILDPTSWAYYKLKHSDNEKFPIGNLLYVPASEVDQVVADFNQGRVVPRYLGHILNLTASLLVQELGEYEPRPEFHNGIMYFTSSEVKFRRTETPLVKADVSVEAGLKSRLTTAQMAAFAHLSQLPSNYMRNWLSKDPFHRVGFEESDKLWEVLKTYRKKAS